MKTFTTVLAAHLRGFSIPRRVAQLVCEAIKPFDRLQVADAYNALPALKETLNNIAETPGFNLSVKQKIAVRSAHRVVKYPDSAILFQFIEKDVIAMSEPTPHIARSEFIWIKLGMESMSDGFPNFQGDPLDNVYMTYQSTIRSSFNSRDKIFTKWAKKYRGGINTYHSLPTHLKGFKRWNEVFGGVIPPSEEDFQYTPYVGNIGIAFEQGMKPRLFASPNLIFQSYLEPVKRYLQGICRNIPEDFHSDQAAGRRNVQKHLKQGETVHCFDLSSATHRFPWVLQRKMLAQLSIPQDYRAILDYVSTGVYNSRFGDMSWNAGQPLGTGPSFFAFSMCHHMLIRGIFSRLGENPNDGYALLGDDVAIYNTRVAKVYAKVMTRIGCVINHSKSIVSNCVGEFAGAYIDTQEIINIGKFRKVSSNNEFNYLAIWDETPAHLTDVSHYLKGTGDRLMNTYIKLYILDKSNLILSTDAYVYPSVQVKKLNQALSDMGVKHQLNPSRYDSRLGHLAYWILDTFNKCAECYPEAVSPHLLSNNMIAMMGLIELIQFAIKDSNQGHTGFTPIWWNNFCQMTGNNPNSYSNYKAVKAVSRHLMMTFFVTSRGSNNVTNRYNKTVKAACKEYRRLEANGIQGLQSELIKMASRNNALELISDELDHIRQIGN